MPRSARRSYQVSNEARLVGCRPNCVIVKRAHFDSIVTGTR
jgi:hypothetical protein